MAFNFGAVNIFELGQLISNKLIEDGVSQQSQLYVFVNNDEFKKIDEDLFYRNKKDENEEFIPSQGEIDVNFEKVKIIVKNQDEK